MPTRLDTLVVDAADPSRLARFWSDVTGWPVTFAEPDEVVVELEGEPYVPFVFGLVDDVKQGKNRLHLDLATRSIEHHAEEVERIRSLGAMPVDIGQGDTPWVVLGDPEGNEFCVLEPRPMYVDTGPVAAMVFDSRDPVAQSRFWQAATGWVVVRSDPQAVSLRRADGGGPYLELLRSEDAKLVKNRLHIDVAPSKEDDQTEEVARLEALGAKRIDIGQGTQTWVVLADPEGNEFCVLSPR
jgi:predicted enzyme related to lactoylglutathione lyase